MSGVNTKQADFQYVIEGIEAGSQVMRKYIEDGLAEIRFLRSEDAMTGASADEMKADLKKIEDLFGTIMDKTGKLIKAVGDNAVANGALVQKQNISLEDAANKIGAIESRIKVFKGKKGES